jgi:predicted negative regulator of RcsB-dependent stress response
VDDYLSEQEQVQRLREWWRENGWFIVGGVVLGVGGLFGWNQYQSYLTSRAEAASALYLALQTTVDDGDEDEAVALFDQLSAEYAKTPYADQGGLAMARLFMESSEPERAAAALRQVMETTADAELSLIARLRLARVLSYLENHAEALALIEAVDSGRFRGRYSEVMGDIYVTQGDSERARAAYEQALSDSEPGLVDRALVQMKLDDLTRTSDQPAGADAMGSVGDDPAAAEAAAE